MARRILHLCLGGLFFGLGFIGIFVPGMPTTIFWILAALSYLKVSPRMYRRIIAHKQFGPPVRLYVEERMITRRGKLISILSTLLMSGLAILLVPALGAKLSIAALALFGIAFVASTKSPPRPNPALPPAAAPLAEGALPPD